MPHFERRTASTPIALRYFNAAGADPDGELGEDHSPEIHLIPRAIDAATGGRGLQVFGDDYPTPDGTCLRDYIHVTDLADAHVRALETLAGRGTFGAYNLGTGHAAFGARRHRRRRARDRAEGALDAGAAPCRRPAVLYASADKARAELGWTPAYPSSTTIVGTAWAWHRAHPRGYRGHDTAACGRRCAIRCCRSSCRRTTSATTIEEIVRRVLAVPLRIELIVVDDCSTDGTREQLQELQRELGFTLLLQPRNAGKGAALRAGFAQVSGDIVVIQDADLEYSPEEYPALIELICSGRADVVYGSRFLGRHRVFLFMHYMGNRLLTLLTNVLYNTMLTDMETCFKADARRRAPIDDAQVESLRHRAGDHREDLQARLSGVRDSDHL